MLRYSIGLICALGNIMETLQESWKVERHLNEVFHPQAGSAIWENKNKPNGKVSKLQEYRLKELQEYGFTVEVYRGEER